MSPSLPASMSAIEICEPGGPDQLKLTTRPLPIPKENEVLIKVAYAGVNRPDVIQRQGLYPPPPGESDIPGLEVSGTIVETGPNTPTLHIGDKVTALVGGGGYAEYCLAPARQCLPIPNGLTMEQAAALPETYFTVWSNVFDRCLLKSGETFLVHGGTSGIGTTAIQLAKAFGAKVITTAGSSEKCEVCLSLGADLAINYRSEDFVEKSKAFTGKKGVDVLLDMVGGDYIQKDISALATEGRLCFIAFLGGPQTTVNFMPVMLKRLTITGSTLRARSGDFKYDVAEKLRKHVWPLLETGKVAPVLYQTLPLDLAAEAHKLMESSQHVGKIMLKVAN
ncbi:NAD(P)H-quinone oxidoreductase [Kiloniella laminariae]|uniref:NAD(P)H-quinone oxidoreductase n=1 Tax=Kiloniella laminariae TaxID=454162 RepID=A0ABT4LIA8_9PROT|nr:NAD(P)H-quinone oxidoreductase [Kiloniella laminariae]MCZ4280839.1 NAD(P)H-quinone oxidoreductase [Kiloniella laminariae]